MKTIDVDCKSQYIENLEANYQELKVFVSNFTGIMEDLRVNEVDCLPSELIDLDADIVEATKNAADTFTEH